MPKTSPVPPLFQALPIIGLCLAAAAWAGPPAAGPSPAEPPTAGPSPALATFSASYTVRYGILRGAMTLRLEREDRAYRYETSLRPRGVASWLRRGEIREAATLLVEADRVLPLDYVSIDSIARPERQTRYVFDAAAGEVRGEYKMKPVSEPMRAGGQSRISAQVAIMQALQTGTDLNRFSVFDRGRWKTFEFDVVRGQPVDTPAGRFDTVEVRYSSPGDKRHWSMYCAPALDHLPVMIVYREGDKTKSRASLTGYEIGGQT